jgi:arylsulfatase A-like enzyme
MDRPNVLLIVLDTARADALEPYGAAPGTTPALAQLASRGRAFPNVHATACWTMPSHASMVTGLLPRAAGLIRAPDGMPGGCRPVLEAARDRVLPEVLRRGGFRTRGVSTNLWVATRSGFATGFDEFRDVSPNRVAKLAATRLRSRARWAFDAVRARSDDGAVAAGQVLREWFGEASDRPEFWFVNLIECHSPYLPPKPWNDLGPLDRLRAAQEARRHLTLGEIWRVCVSDFDVPPEALERMRHLYDRSIRQLDAWVADTLTALDEAGKLDDTLVLICSDHGENFGEGGLLGHAYSLDERLLHVPFIAAGPNAPDEMTSLVELARAIADAVGVDNHPWERTRPTVAVAQFDPPGETDDPRRLEAVKTWGAGPEALKKLSSTIDAAVRGSTKLLRRGDEFQLFELAEDPLEERPRVVSRSEAPPDLVAAIEDQATTPLVAGPAAGDGDDASAEELARIEDQMRTLGYL